MKQTMAPLAAGAGLVFLGVAGVLTICSSAAAESTVWTDDAIAALFPAPPDGWTVEDVAIEKRDAIASGFEFFALAPLAESATAGVSVRLTATRAYHSGERTIEVSIDTEDIETAAMVDAVDAVSGAEDGGPEELVAYGEGLLAAGVTAISHDGYPGVAAGAHGEAARAFKIGSAGAVSLECAYPDCGADLDAMTARLDFSAIAEFVVFDHRR